MSKSTAKRTYFESDDSLVRLVVSPSLDGNVICTYQESRTHDETTVFADISVAVRNDGEPFEFLIQAVDDDVSIRNVYASKSDLVHHTPEEEAYINNTINKEGVIYMNPFQQFQKDLKRFVIGAAPAKLGTSGLLSIYFTWQHIPLVNEIGSFTGAAILECILALLPRVHVTKDSRFFVAIGRFWLWVGSLLAIGALILLKQAFLADNPTGISRVVIEYLVNIGATFIIPIYGGAIVWSIAKLRYGSKAEKFVPKPLKGFIDTGQ